ncbi:MAG: PQQ-binding-like beta-propeller repeat protein [Acidobacteria bacterium]|nr:PQQ-binding-like beta-propeller repeat protein [Acidobacteriota bacterium]
MPRTRRFFLPLLSSLLALALAPAVAADWPQWRGPALDGSSEETGLPLTWSATENVLWRLAMPARSAATPIVWGDRIFLNISYDPDKDGRLELWCVSRSEGKVLWKRPLGQGNELKYKQHMSTPSPVTDGKRVWVMTGTGVIKAFDFDGKELWARDLQKEYGTFGLQWGYASSPLLFEGALIVQVLNGMHTDDPSYLLSIDGGTGKTRWRTERPTKAIRESPDAYSTPMLLRREGRAEVVVSGGDVLTGHDAVNGKELWRVGNLNPGNSPAGRLVASPLVSGRRIFAFGKRGPIQAFEAPEGSGAPPKLLWNYDKGTDVPTPVTDGTYLYVINDRAVAWCFEAATGRIVWGPERMPSGTYSASPVLADGRIYVTNEEGTTAVLEAGPKFNLLAENALGSYTLSSPAIADGKIYLRTSDYLYAIGRGNADSH